MSERQYWVGFNIVRGVGPVRTRLLLDYFGSLRAAWTASAQQLREAGLDKRAIASVEETRKRVDPEAELNRLDKLGITILIWDDEDYPELLSQLRPIDHAPPLLYMRGQLTEQDTWALTIVGTRSASPYGRQVTYQLARELAAKGLTIVSGLARGIDAEAHQAALKAGGRTIAFLPCGMDRIYPPEHRQLAARIIQQGALLSTFSLGTQPEGKNFAPRNRVMSGISRGVLVTEAGHKSGALLTAGHALDQGREIFAVPGNITARGSDGTNQLIRDGAHPVMASDDILTALNLENLSDFSDARVSLPAMSGEETDILACVSSTPLHIDEITQQCGLPIHQVNSLLTMLELKGVIRTVDAMTYIRT